eukprot:2804237-Amphidinium_carterae.2
MSFARCLVCYRQTGKVKGKFNYSYLMRQECRPLRKTLKQRCNVAPEVEPLAPLATGRKFLILWGFRVSRGLPMPFFEGFLNREAVLLLWTVLLLF